MTDPRSPAAVLALRLDTLSEVIEKVREATRYARARRQHLEDLDSLVGPGSELRSCFYEIDAGLRSAMKVVRTLDQEVPQRELSGRERADMDLAATRKPDSIEALWRGITTHLDQIRPPVNDAVGHSADGHLDDVRKSFENACEKTRMRVEELKARLTNLARSQDDEPPLDELWKGYERLLRENARPLFDAYVDFLGGVTLRDTGLDGQVCDKADALLLEQYAEFGAASLTVPVREALSDAAVRFVRIGFPEWTVWGLPLAAHEFGLIVANDRNSQEALQWLIERYAGDDPRAMAMFRRLVADAFATLSMGPAYAAAAIFLRFSPLPLRRNLKEDLTDQEWGYLGRRLIAGLGAGARGFLVTAQGAVQRTSEHEAARASDEELPEDRRDSLDKIVEWALRVRRGDDQPADSERAFLIRCVLLKMGGGDREVPFGKVVARVLEAWTDALDHARNLPPQPGGYEEHDFALPENERKLLSDFVEELMKMAPLRNIAGVDRTRFVEIHKWSERLCSGDFTTANSPPNRYVDLLNAAWAARLDPACSTATVALIAERVETIWAGQLPQPEDDGVGAFASGNPGEHGV